MQFEERTIKVIIDDEKCLACETQACVASLQEVRPGDPGAEGRQTGPRGRRGIRQAPGHRVPGLRV